VRRRCGEEYTEQRQGDMKSDLDVAESGLGFDNKQCFDKSLKIECAKLLFSI